MIEVNSMQAQRMVSSGGGWCQEVWKAFLDEVTLELTLKRGEAFADSLGLMGRRRKAFHAEETERCSLGISKMGGT